MALPTRAGFIRTEQDALNDTEALRLRSLGYSYGRIAEELGIAKSTAYERTQRALTAIGFEFSDMVVFLRAILKLDSYIAMACYADDVHWQAK